MAPRPTTVGSRRLFLSFAAQDLTSRNLLVAAVEESELPYVFLELSIKVPEDRFWQEHCLAKIRSCDALIVFLSNHTRYAKGVLWEVDCARKASVPVLAVKVSSKPLTHELPQELQGVPVREWREDELSDLLATF